MTSGDLGDHRTQRDQPSPADPAPRTERPHVPKTRAGAAWVGSCLAAALAVALVIFLAQNTQRVHISFLWLDTDTPLALALLIAAVAAALITLAIGSTRILQLRRRVHQQDH
jgi:uncharacterized integral membrane protein